MILKLTHANLKRPVYCQTQLIDAWYYDKTTESTLIFLAKGNMLPVEESCEEIERLITNAGSPQGAHTDGK